MFLPFAILNGILWAFLRRIYGGALEAYPIIRERGVQTFLMLATMFAIIYPYEIPSYNNLALAGKIMYTLSLSCWLQFMYWSLGHGMVMWIGTDGKPKNEKELKRYQEMWGYKQACKIVPQKNWYGPFFDWLLMKIRYVFPMIPMMLIHPLYMLPGWMVGNTYALCSKAYQEDHWIWEKFPKWVREKWVGGPTSMGEALSGFNFGFFIYIIHRVLLANA